MFYLTFNEQPSGVYSSQVTDVVTYLNTSRLANIRLVAFISMRGFGANRNRIRSEAKGAIVLPALPRGTKTGFSTFLFMLLCLFTGERKVICRNVMACNMALALKSIGLKLKIVYDGRGAIAAEWNEYDVVPSEKLKQAIPEMERKAVLMPDFRIAVSQQLVDHWRSAYGYTGDRHAVIPCTVSSSFAPGLPSEEALQALRERFGYLQDDIVLVYSGSTAGWQSFGTLEKVLQHALRSSNRIKLLFLSGKDPAIEKMKMEFLGQVESRWLKHTEVPEMLMACDAGILFREQSITNKVASPTKFAEYLAAGLPVIISENLGDYSDFVRKESCGQVLSGTGQIVINKPSYQEKIRLNGLVNHYFTKSSQTEKYRNVVSAVSGN